METKPHPEDENTLRQLREILAMDHNAQRAMEDAYHLGRIRGKVEGVVACADKLAAV